MRARDSFGLFSRTGRVDARRRGEGLPAARRRCAACSARPRRSSTPATSSRGGRARAPSSPTCARSRSATACAGSTGGRARAAGELWVNEQHPERNMDVVLFLDSFAEVRRGSASSTLDLAVRGGGDARRAVHPAARPGRARLLRRLRSAGSRPAAASSSSTASSTRCSTRRSRSATRGRRSTSSRPGRCRRRRSSIALTPAPRRAVGARAAAPARARLRPRRGRALAARRSSSPGPEETERLAYRLWSLQREALRSQFLAAGVPVVRVAGGRAARRPDRGGDEIHGATPELARA